MGLRGPSPLLTDHPGEKVGRDRSEEPNVSATSTWHQEHSTALLPLVAGGRGEVCPGRALRSLSRLLANEVLGRPGSTIPR
jgi:hypothetical protein